MYLHYTSIAICMNVYIYTNAHFSFATHLLWAVVHESLIQYSVGCISLLIYIICSPYIRDSIFLREDVYAVPFSVLICVPTLYVFCNMLERLQLHERTFIFLQLILHNNLMWPVVLKSLIQYFVSCISLLINNFWPFDWILKFPQRL